MEKRENEIGTKFLQTKGCQYIICKSVEDGKFWFNGLIRRSFNFDKVLWLNIELLLPPKRA